MCISRLTQHCCGHAERAYFNRHCQCALIVGPIVDAVEPCANRCANSTPMKPAAQLPMTPPETPSSAEGLATVKGGTEAEQDRHYSQ